MNIFETLNELRFELIRQHPNEAEIKRFKKGDRNELVRKIENVTLQIIRTVADGKQPYFSSIQFGRKENCVYNDRLQLREHKQLKKRRICFGRVNSCGRFAVVVVLLSKIHKMLLSCKTCTRRDLYYGNTELFRSQFDVDAGMMDVCYILNAPPWELGVSCTTKGLVAGPLIFKSDDGIMDCDKPGGVLIPQDILDVELISANIRWVLIVEKDAAFQRILDADALTKLRECVFITGKGYPDFNTRLLVCRLWEKFRVPILALVDADPYGLEIMCVYRFGSYSHCQFSESLACPSVRWLGVHPSDMKLLAVESAPLGEKDLRRIASLADRPYIKQNEKIRSEIEVLLDEKVKVEIEGISNVSMNYITDVYIPSKVQCKEYF